MKYQVTYYNEFYDQCYKNCAINEDDITTFPIRKTTDVLIGNTYEQCIEFVKDFLDVPKTLLTLEEVKKDFGLEISDNNAEKIIKFYNGRYAVFQTFLKEIDVAKNKVSENAPIYLTYNLPEEMNSFSFEDDDHYQLNSYVEVLIEQ